MGPRSYTFPAILAPANKAGAAHPGTQPWLAGVVHRTCSRDVHASAGLGTSASDRPPPLRRPPGRAFAGMRISRKVQETPAVTSLWLVPVGRGCPSRSAAGTVHNAAAGLPGPTDRARPAHLLAIGPAGCWRVPGQRKARTRWDRQHVHPRRAIGGGDPGSRCATEGRLLCVPATSPWSSSRPGSALPRS